MATKLYFRQACSSQLLMSMSTKITTNTETAMLSTILGRIFAAYRCFYPQADICSDSTFAPFRQYTVQNLRRTSDYQFSFRWQDSKMAGWHWPPNTDKQLVINTCQINCNLSVLSSCKCLFRLQFIAPFRHSRVQPATDCKTYK